MTEAYSITHDPDIDPRLARMLADYMNGHSGEYAPHSVIFDNNCGLDGGPFIDGIIRLITKTPISLADILVVGKISDLIKHLRDEFEEDKPPKFN